MSEAPKDKAVPINTGADAGSAVPAPVKGAGRILPIGIDKEETRYKILTELLKAEDHYVKKIKGARHSITHEIMSDSSAIVGALTTFQFAYIKSLLAVTPIVGMLVWEGIQARKDLRRLHSVVEMFRRTNDPGYFHGLGLELEGIPRTEDLTREQRVKMEKDIKAILGKPASFGDSLHNLRDRQPVQKQVEETGRRLRGFRLRQVKDIGRNLAAGSKRGANALLETVRDLKNLKTLPQNYVMASLVMADQCKDVIYLPLKEQFERASAPVKEWYRAKWPSKEQPRGEIEETPADSGVTVARVKRSKKAVFAADPHELVREIDGIKKGMRKAAVESTVNGIAFTCQTAFCINQAILSGGLAAGGEWGMALAVALPSMLALSPLNYFAKNQIDKNNQMKSSRADMARRLEQRAKTLQAVDKIKKMIGEIQKEKDEGAHLKLAQELVAMFGDSFNPEWFEKDQRAKLKALFEMVAAHKDEDKPAAPAQAEKPAAVVAEENSAVSEAPPPSTLAANDNPQGVGAAKKSPEMPQPQKPRPDFKPE